MEDLREAPPPPSDQIFLDFIQFSGKFNILKIPPPPQDLCPHCENRGYATVVNVISMYVQTLKRYMSDQWRFQDFHKRVDANPKGGTNLLFSQFVTQTASKLGREKEARLLRPAISTTADHSLDSLFHTTATMNMTKNFRL